MLQQWVVRGLTSAAILVTLAAPSAAASVLALDSTISVATGVQGGGTWGWEFIVSAPVVVDGLGFLDLGADGLGTSHQVGLWDGTSSALLASTTVTSGSTLVASADASGDWRFESVAPIVLGPGVYIIGAYYPVGPFGGTALDGGLASATVITTIPEVSFVTSRGSAGAFGIPGALGGTYAPGVFGPTFSVARSVTPVPEPGSLMLLGVGGLACAARRARDRSGRSKRG